ncbi:hypothetical protein PUN28_004521 [Cardiocondyla obscurior]|uniref:Chitin-binding type-2 domain-containing protein n=1 Tax=Cardiocondyla obscurior TaxID=286306 RepID=A0AAW2GE57_9HYME
MKGKYLIAVAFLASWTVITASQLPFFFEDENECPAPPDPSPPKLISHESDCDKYYECRNGQKALRVCSTGLFFSKRWRGCVDQRYSDCPLPTTPPTTPTPTSPTTPTPNVCPAPPDPCPPVLLSHESNCTLFYECQNGRAILRFCAPNLFFSLKWRGCVDQAISDCPPPTPTPTPTSNPRPDRCEKDGDLLPHECNCAEFYLCKNGGKALQQCQPGHIFNPLSRTCEKGDPKTCKLDDPDPICEEGELIPHECDCIHYYECKNGQKALRECPEGENFHNGTLQCEKGFNCSWPICSEGNRTKHGCNCEKYYECENNDWYLRNCSNNTHYNEATQTCTSPITAGCETPGYCKDNSKKWHHECDCRLYYECKNNTKTIHDCAWGEYFNNVTLTCEILTDDATCKNDWDPWKIDDYYF